MDLEDMLGGIVEESRPASELSPLWKAMQRWHESLPPRMVRALTDQLKFLEKSGEPLTVASACSGTDIGVAVLQMMSQYWMSTFGREVRIRHVFACESAVVPQQFLLFNFPELEAIIPDASFLGDKFAPTVLRGPSNNSLELPEADWVFHCVPLPSLHARILGQTLRAGS